jgi:hypothetical protein
MINLDTVFKYYLNFINLKSHWRYLKLMKARKRIFPARSAEDKNSHFAYFNLKGARWHYDLGRYTYLLIKSFELSGFPIIIHQNYSLLSRLIKYKSLLLKVPFKIGRYSLNRTNWQGRNVILVKKGALCKKIHLGFNQHRTQTEGLLFPMPYLMHPIMYSDNLAGSVRELRNRTPLFKILFAGNTDQKEYSRVALKEKFNKTNRYQAIEYVKNNLQADTREIIANLDSLLAPESYKNKLLLVHSSHLKIPFVHWLPIIANADFFLACSGSRMPMCHNVIEAMAVGTVPILEYPEYFHPPLEHGYNCIAYSGLEDLKDKLEELLDMNTEAIKSLKKNVIAYYDNYLDPEKWVQNLLAIQAEEVTLIVDAHLIPHKKEIPTDFYISEDSIPNLTNQKPL